MKSKLTFLKLQYTEIKKKKKKKKKRFVVPFTMKSSGFRQFLKI